MPASFSWTPTTDEVADAMVARVPNGFSADTTPTDTRVAGLIDLVAMEIVGEVSTFDPTVVTGTISDTEGTITLGDLARVACVWGSAAYAEETLAPESAYLGDNNSYDAHLYRRYRQAVARLRDAIQRNRGQDKAAQLYIGRRRVAEDARYAALLAETQ